MNNTIILELTIKEAKIIQHTISSSLPDRENEMISMMLYARITRKLEEATGQNESL